MTGVLGRPRRDEDKSIFNVVSSPCPCGGVLVTIDGVTSCSNCGYVNAGRRDFL